ncbi:MAG TPA: hypothetical protein VF680_11775 [Allosphingosinicella sp.]
MHRAAFTSFSRHRELRELHLRPAPSAAVMVFARIVNFVNFAVLARRRTLLFSTSLSAAPFWWS